MKKAVSMVLLCLGTVCLMYYGVCTWQVGSGIPLLWLWPTAGAVLLLAGGIGLVLRRRSRVLAVLQGLLLACCTCFLAFFFCVLCEVCLPPEPGAQYVLILGAAVDGSVPTPALEARIDAAWSYLEANPQAIAVATGGRSPEDSISEARCIAQELISRGMDPQRILLEEQSSTTVENIRFALPLLPEQPSQIAIVSNGYHLFRAKCILRSFCPASVTTVAASGFGPMTPHYILREFAAFFADLFQGNYNL